jgi:type IV secretory pathway VirJ component
MLRQIAFSLAMMAATAGQAPAMEPAAMPITELPVAARGDTLAIFYSGDGGWAEIDKGVSQALASSGLPVVGVDSLRYFWRRRTPEEAAHDLEAVMRRYSAQWGRTRFVLVGFSFGAGALPPIAQRLPEDLRSKVRLVALIGMGARGDLKFHLNGWMGQQPSDGYPIAPAVESLKDLPVACFYGDKEHADACPTLEVAGVRKTALRGDHHFGGDYIQVATAVRRAAGL